jgi:hypothetical protein
MVLEKMLKIKRTDRITNYEVFQRAKEKRLPLKFKKIDATRLIISGEKTVGRPRLQYLKQVARNTGADSYTAMKRMACNKSRWKAANQSKD